MSSRIRVTAVLFIVCMVASMIASVGCGDDPPSAPVIERPTPVLVSGGYGIADTSYLRGDTIFSYDSTYRISIGEGNLGDNYPMNQQIGISQATDEIFGWYNLRILNNVQTSPGKIQFVDEGILLPKTAMFVFGAANARSSFEMPHGTYMIEFIKGDSTDTYQVKIDELTIKISPQAGTFTHMAHKVFWRKRRNSCVLICSLLPEVSYLCDEVADSLLTNVELEEFFYPDSGAIGYERSNADRIPPLEARYFLYDEEADFLKAESVVVEFNLAHQDVMLGSRIMVVNWSYGSN